MKSKKQIRKNSIKKFMLFASIVLIAVIALSFALKFQQKEIQLAAPEMPAAPEQAPQSFNLGTDCALGIAGTVSPVIGTGLQVVNFIMNPEGSALGILKSLPLGPLGVSYGQLELLSKSPTALAKSQAYSTVVKEIAKSDPVVGAAIDSCTNAREKLMADPASGKKVASIEIDENKNVKTEFHGITKGTASLGKEAGYAKEDDFLVSDGVETDKSKDNLITLKFTKSGNAEIKDLGLTINANAGSEVVFNKEKGTLDLTKGTGAIKLGERQYANLANAHFTVKNKQIEFADFDVSAKTSYEFDYNNEKILVNAEKGGHVKFDPKNSKKIEGKLALVSYKGQIINGEFTVDLDSSGNIIKVTLLKKGSSYSFEDYLVRATAEKSEIYFDGKQHQGDYISFSKDKILLAGSIELNRFINVKGVQVVKYTVTGTSNTFAEIARKDTLDTIMVRTGKLGIIAGAVPGYPSGTSLSLTANKYVDLTDSGELAYGIFSTVNGNIKKEIAGKMQTDIAKLLSLGPEKFKEYASLRAEIYDAKGDKEKLSALAKQHPELLEQFPELKSAITAKQLQIKAAEVNKKEKEINDAFAKTGAAATITKFEELKNQYPEFSNQISMDMADIYAQTGVQLNIARAKKLRNEVYISEAVKLKAEIQANPDSPDNLAKRLELAAYYNNAERQDIATNEYNSIISNADRIISTSTSSVERDNAINSKAKALASIGKDSASIIEYQKLALSSDKEIASTARLNLAILKSRGTSEEKLVAIGDLSALEKISAEINDPAMGDAAHRLARNLRLELLKENSQKALDGDAQAAIIANSLKNQLRLDQNEIDDVIKGYSTDYNTLYGGNVPAEVKKQLDDYNKELNAIAAMPGAIGLTKVEFEKAKTAEINLELERTTTVFKNEYATSTAGKNKGEIKIIEEEIIQKDQITQGLEKDLAKIVEDQYAAEKNGLASLAESKKIQALKYQEEISKRKFAITGNQKYGLDIATGKILDLQSQKSELQGSEKWYGSITRSIPYVGPAISGVLSEDSKQITKLDTQINQLGKEWENNRIAIDMKDGNLGQRYNPLTGNYESIEGTFYAGQERDMLKYKKAVETVRDTSFTAAEIMIPGAIAGSAVKIGSKALLAGTKSLWVEKFITGAIEGEKLTGLAKIGYGAERYAAKAIVEGTVFHYSGISTRAYASGLEYALAPEGSEDRILAEKALGIGLEGQEKVEFDKQFWDPRGSIQTFLVLPVGSVAEQAVVKKSAFLTETVAGRYVSTMTINPVLSSTALTLSSMPDILSQLGGDSKTTADAIVQNYAENLKLTVGLNMLHLGQAKSAEIKNTKENKEPISRISAAKENYQQLYAERGKIIGDPANKFESGELTETALIRLNEIQKQEFELQKIMNDNQRQIIENSKTNGQISDQDYNLNIKKINLENAEIGYNSRQFEVEKKQGFEGLSSKEIMLAAPELIVSAKSLSKAKEEYVVELEKQSTRLESTEDSNKNNFDFKKLKQDLETEKKSIAAIEKESKKLESAKIKTETAKKTLADALSEESLQKTIDTTPADSKEHIYARSQLAKTLYQSGKYTEASAQYDILIKEYNSYPGKDISGLLPEFAVIEKANAEALAGDSAKAIKDLTDFEKTAKQIPSETIKAEEEKLGRQFLEQTTPEFIETNFRAIGVPENLIADAIANPAKRYDISKQYINEPALMAAGLPVTKAQISPASSVYSEASNLYASGDYAKAESLFSSIISRADATAEAKLHSQVMVGQSQLKLGKYEEAIASFRAYLKEAPKYPELKIAEVEFSTIHIQIADTLALQGKYSEAVSELQALKETLRERELKGEEPAWVSSETIDGKIASIQAQMAPEEVKALMPSEAQISALEKTLSEQAYSINRPNAIQQTALPESNAIYSQKQVESFFGVDPYNLDGPRMGGVMGGAILVLDKNYNGWVRKEFMPRDAEAKTKNELLTRNMIDDLKTAGIIKTINSPEAFAYLDQRIGSDGKPLSRWIFLNREVKDSTARKELTLEEKVDLAVLKEALGLSDMNYGNYLRDKSGNLEAFDFEWTSKSGGGRFYSDYVDEEAAKGNVNRRKALEHILIDAAVPYVSYKEYNDFNNFKSSVDAVKSNQEKILNMLDASAAKSGMTGEQLQALKEDVRSNMQNLDQNIKSWLDIANEVYNLKPGEPGKLFPSDIIGQSGAADRLAKEAIKANLPEGIAATPEILDVLALARQNKILQSTAIADVAELLEKQGMLPEEAAANANLAVQRVRINTPQSQIFLESATPEFIRTNFEAMNIPSLDVETAVSDPSQRYDLLVKAGKDPNLLMGGLPAKATSAEVAKLIEDLKSNDIQVRWDAVDALGKFGKPAVPALIEATKNSDEGVRQSAALTLGQIGDKSAVPALIGLLKDSNVGVRQSAIITLGNIGDERAVLPLIEALKDSDYGHIVNNARNALMKIGEPAVPALIEALKDSNEGVRSESAKALGLIEDARAVQPLIDTLKDSNTVVKAVAAQALGQIKDARAVPALIETLKDPVYYVRQAAEYSLTKIGKPAVPNLIEALKDSDPIIRIESALVLGDIYESFSTGRMPAAISEKGEVTVIELNPKAAISALIEASKDPDADVRSAITQSLDKIVPTLGSSINEINPSEKGMSTIAEYIMNEKEIINENRIYIYVDRLNKNAEQISSITDSAKRWQEIKQTITQADKDYQTFTGETYYNNKVNDYSLYTGTLSRLDAEEYKTDLNDIAKQLKISTEGKSTPQLVQEIDSKIPNVEIKQQYVDSFDFAKINFELKLPEDYELRLKSTISSVLDAQEVDLAELKTKVLDINTKVDAFDMNYLNEQKVPQALIAQAQKDSAFKENIKAFLYKKIELAPEQTSTILSKTFDRIDRRLIEKYSSGKLTTEETNLFLQKMSESEIALEDTMADLGLKELYPRAKGSDQWSVFKDLKINLKQISEKQAASTSKIDLVFKEKNALDLFQGKFSGTCFGDYPYDMARDDIFVMKILENGDLAGSVLFNIQKDKLIMLGFDPSESLVSGLDTAKQHEFVDNVMDKVYAFAERNNYQLLITGEAGGLSNRGLGEYIMKKYTVNRYGSIEPRVYHPNYKYSVAFAYDVKEIVPKPVKVYVPGSDVLAKSSNAQRVSAERKAYIITNIKDIISNPSDEIVTWIDRAYKEGGRTFDNSKLEIARILESKGMTPEDSASKANLAVERLRMGTLPAAAPARTFAQLKDEVREKTKNIISLNDESMDFLTRSYYGGDSVLRASDFELSLKLQGQGVSVEDSPELANKIIFELLKRKKVIISGENLEDIQSRLDLKVFYTVQGPEDIYRLMTGEGEWPTDPTRANLGPGVYAWDNLDSAAKYLEARSAELKRNDLSIVAVAFYESTIEDLNSFDLTKLSDKEANKWLNGHSLLYNKAATPADYEYVIRGVSEKYGEEHYFPAEVFKDYADVAVVS